MENNNQNISESILSSLEIIQQDIGSDEQETLAVCPRSDCRKKKFYYNEQKGVGHCKSCGYKGNNFEIARDLGLEFSNPANIFQKIDSLSDALEYIKIHAYKHVKSFTTELIKRFNIEFTYQHGKNNNSYPALIFSDEIRYLNLFNREEKTGKIKPRWMSIPGKQASGFTNLKRLIENQDYIKKNRVFIVNGEWSIFRLWQESEIDAICLKSGEGGKNRDNYGNVSWGKDKDIFIFSDGDKTAKEGVEKLKALLGQYARSITVIEVRQYLKDGKDLEDYFHEGYSVSDFFNLVESKLKLYELTDSGNADRFAEEHKDQLIYAEDQWLNWNGKVYARIKEEEVKKLAIGLTRKMHRQSEFGRDGKIDKELSAWAIRSQNRQRINGIMDLTKGFMFVKADKLDSDRLLFNCQNGILDLKSETLIPHSSESMLTRISPANFNLTAKCPKFLEFINWAMNNIQEMVSYLQTVFGACLSGKALQNFFIFWGSGANGKSTLTDIISYVLGDYATAIKTKVLLDDRYKRVDNDIAELKGMRFVSTSESGRSQRLDEEFLKRLTGGDEVVGRQLYSRNIHFWPELKLFMHTNHRPKIEGQDHAIWRRIQLIEFKNAMPKDKQRDKSEVLKEFIDEKDGILAWLFEGWRRFQKNDYKLFSPETVVTATEEYKSEEDILGEWIAQKCTIDINDKRLCVAVRELYFSYCSWAEENKEKPISKNKFGMILEEKGLSRRRNEKGIQYLGIKIKN